MRTMGLTLVELMVTLAIVAMTAVAALAVVTDLSRVEGMERHRQQEVTWLAPVRDLLASDLAHATQYRVSEGGFVLRAQASLDAATLEQRHLPAAVQYVVRRIGARPWLMRFERPETAGNDMAELVCPGVRGLLLEPVPQDAATPAAAAPAAPTGPDAWQNVPAAVVVTVVQDGAERPSVAFTIRRH